MGSGVNIVERESSKNFSTRFYQLGISEKITPALFETDHNTADNQQSKSVSKLLVEPNPIPSQIH